jgi:hypothetical protein
MDDDAGGDHGNEAQGGGGYVFFKNTVRTFEPSSLSRS